MEAYKVVSIDGKGQFRSVLVRQKGYERVYNKKKWTWSSPKRPMATFDTVANAYSFLDYNTVTGHRKHKIFKVEIEDIEPRSKKFKRWCLLNGCFDKETGDNGWPIGTILCHRVRLISEVP